MSTEWVIVFTTNQAYEAEMVKVILTDHEIECYVVNKQDSAYLIGDIEVYVSTEMSFQAKQLILQFKGE
jgi:hypothetical protein